LQRLLQNSAPLTALKLSVRTSCGVSGLNSVNKLIPLWLVWLGMGQASSLAVPSLAASLSLNSKVQIAPQPLTSHPSIHLRLAQANATATKAGKGSAEKSLAQLAQRYRCVAPKAVLKNDPSRNRIEMAALLASCLESLGDRPLDAQEQSTIKTLRSEFKLELAALRNSQNDIIRLRQSVDPSPGIQLSNNAAIGSSLRWVKGQDLDSLLLRPQDETAPNRLGLKAEANFGKVGVFGRYTVAVGTPLSLPDGANLSRNDVNPSLSDRSFENWSAGIGIRGFIIPKSVLALTAGHTLASPLGQPNPINYGAFYQFPIGNSLTVSPSVTIITNPNNTSNPDIQGAVQASFSF
jgi:hypothetical protein